VVYKERCIHRTSILCLFISLGLFCSQLAYAASRIVDVNEGFEAENFLVPYAFYNENLNVATGAAFGTVGHPQQQLSLVGTAFGSTNDSWGLYLLGFDYQLPFGNRLFLDPWISVGKFGELKSYSDGNPEFPNERAGSNDSDEDNYIEGKGTDQHYRLRFKYLLPIGHGSENIIHTYVVDRGLLVSGQTGSDVWNPFESGRSFIEVEPFYRRQNIDSDYDDVTQKTNGVKFSLFYDNRDFTLNPSKGSSQRLSISRDWDLFDSSEPWTVVEAELSKYFSLGSTENLRQQVLAFNFWTADTLTWESDGFVNGKETFKRPPSFAGATLGGLFRMRGYPAARFNDKAAIYYTAEYRVIPRWNPFDNFKWSRDMEVNWIQGVLFAEVGRVAEHWVIDELHDDMKWDAGIGFRAWVKNIIVRVDTAYSEEGIGLQMMVAHPF
jgi:hypothetical protein